MAVFFFSFVLSSLQRPLHYGQQFLYSLNMHPVVELTECENDLNVEYAMKFKTP